MNDRKLDKNNRVITNRDGTQEEQDNFQEDIERNQVTALAQEQQRLQGHVLTATQEEPL